MRVLRVDRGAQDVSIERMELVDAVTERNELRGAHEGKVKRIEYQHDPFAAIVLVQIELDKLLVVNGGGDKARRSVLDARESGGHGAKSSDKEEHGAKLHRSK
eukprot:Amastigsp_a175624_117.p3 type:complete len:103 gc:universal Amastigsp_a175624_117:334-26(-)